VAFTEHHGETHALEKRGESMWLLILFSAVVNSVPGGGASHTITTVQFASETECTAAKSRLSAGSAIPSVITGHSNVVLILNGICVQQTK